MRIGIDVDSVLAMTDEAWHQYYRTHDQGHGHVYPFPPRMDGHHWNYWPDICKGCFNHVLHSDEVVRSMDVMPGALPSVMFLARSFELFAITSRPAEVEASTIRWLRDKSLLGLFRELIVNSDKLQVCRDLGIIVMIDDSPKIIESFIEGEHPVIIFDQPWNRHLEGNRAANWPVAAGIAVSLALQFAVQAEQAANFQALAGSEFSRA